LRTYGDVKYKKKYSIATDRNFLRAELEIREFKGFCVAVLAYASARIIEQISGIGAPAWMKPITTFPLEHYDIATFGPQTPPRASAARRTNYE
jgi:hypothetical protein